MTTPRSALVIALALVAACSTSKPPDARVASWRADLVTLGRELPARHVEPFFHVDEPRWRADLAALDAALPGLTDDQITARAAQLVAELGDGHTRVAAPNAAGYPLQAFWFDDGLYVIAAPADQLWAVGGEIVTIGDRPAADALALLGTVAPHDNVSQLHSEAAAALANPTMVRGLGLAGAGGALAVTIRTAAGPRPLTLAPSVTRPVAPRSAVVAMARRAGAPIYWSEYLPAARTLFVQYNACREATPPFADFVAELGKTIAAQHVERLVIDLRANGGGNSNMFEPFLALMAAHPEVRVLALIGRATFSSAVLNALSLEDAGAVLVGEMAGGAPSHHGEVKTFMLPEHGLIVMYSTKFFPHPRHPGAELVPALAVPVTAVDYFAGKDATLDAALAAP